MILAAGFGTRLWPLTEQRSKPAIPFLNRPLITYSVEYLASHGIREIIVNLHHHPESTRRALGDGSDLGVSIHYSYEEEILGTSGALDRVRDKLGDDDFVVMNGKIVTNIDLDAAIRTHREREAIATLVLRENAAREHFSIVETDQLGRIARFAGFPDSAVQQNNCRSGTGPGLSESDSTPLMFTGIQVLSPRIFNYIPQGRFSHSTIHVYPRAMEAGETVVGHLSYGDWYEMSTLERYLHASLALMRKRRDGGGGGSAAFVAGDGSVIGEAALIEDSVLWENVVVGRGVRLRRVVVADRVRIPDVFEAESAVVVRRDAVSEAERGEVVGENLIVRLR